jgi:undecaprenyl-diphosphatase
MSILHAIILGIAQGISEFLPISSSGHLILIPWLFGWNDFAGNAGLEKSFDVALHLGTVVAVIVYFRADIFKYVRAGLVSLARRRIETLDEKIGWLIIVTAVPGVITGALLDDIVTEHLGAPWLIGLMLIVFGVVLFWADRLPATRQHEELTLRDALFCGVAQAVALQPGVSRSGATMSMARARGFDRESAARISFLMSVPITTGAVVFKMAKLLADGGVPADARSAFAAGILASGVSGFIAVAGLLKLLRTKSFAPFVIYRILLGVGVLLLAATAWR